MRVNKTKLKLQAGGTALGANIVFNSPETVEILGALGYDYAIFDLEHEPFDELAVVHSIRAAEAFDLTPIVRIPNDADLILRFLDAGAQGVHVPCINTPDDAKKVVDAARFHPQGQRTFYATARGGMYGIGVTEEEFAEFSNRETLITLQIEGVEGIRNLAEILAVPHVDAIQIGPKDLRQSMGFADPSRVWEVVEDALKRSANAGRWTSMVAWIGGDSNAGKIARYGELGVRMITAQPREFLIHGARAFLDLAVAALALPRR